MEIQRSTDRKNIKRASDSNEGKVTPAMTIPLPNEHLFRTEVGVDAVEIYLNPLGYSLPYYAFEKRTEKRKLIISVNTESDYYEYARQRGGETLSGLLLQSFFDVGTLLWMRHDNTIHDAIEDFALIKGKFLDMYAIFNSRA